MFFILVTSCDFAKISNWPLGMSTKKRGLVLSPPNKVKVVNSRNRPVVVVVVVVVGCSLLLFIDSSVFVSFAKKCWRILAGDPLFVF